MERFCGILQNNLRSPSRPWANLDNRVLRMAYLNQLAARYDLEDEISEDVNYRRSDEVKRNERVYPECK
jgi:hypothetical protein